MRSDTLAVIIPHLYYGGKGRRRKLWIFGGRIGGGGGGLMELCRRIRRLSFAN